MNRVLCATVMIAATTLCACTGDHKNTLAPSPTPNATAPGSATSSLMGFWTSQSIVASLPSPTTCGNFQYQIASQTATTIAGTFTASCGDSLTVTASGNGEINGSNVTVHLNGSGNLPTNPNCEFSIVANGTLEDGGDTLRLPFSGTTCLGPVHGTEVLHRPQPAASTPPPAPAPTPTPTPAPTPTPSGPDAIDLRLAAVSGGSPGDIANWPITTMITAMDFNNSGVALAFSKKSGPGRWPDVVPPGWDGPLQYTLWMVVNIGGQWYTSGGVEYWAGLERSGGPPSQFARNWYYNPQVWGPLANHQPATGEQVGFFVSAGDARAKNVYAVRERSNVVVVPFPTYGGYFTF